MAPQTAGAARESEAAAIVTKVTAGNMSNCRFRGRPVWGSDADAQALNSSSDWRCASPTEPRGSAASGYWGSFLSPVGVANR